jgi:hypothetical protein
MFRRFFNNIDDRSCIEFRDKVLATGKEYSPASVQGHLLNYKENPEMAIENAQKISPQPKIWSFPTFTSN